MQLKQLKDNWDDLFWWEQKALPYFQNNSLRVISKLYWDLSGLERSELMEEEWDNLIWLDACRYDLFRETYKTKRELTHKYAKDIPTTNFLSSNFSNRELNDTVYITSHPMYTKHNLENEFYDVIDVWDTDWDDDLYTVRPDSMAKRTIETFEKYPNKRIISHFMQPHYPFIGEYAQSVLPEQIGFKPRYEKEKGGEWKNYQKMKNTIWQRLEKGEIDKETVWRCYKENLEITFPHVSEIIDKAEGLTVITSDHGNMLGERAWPIPSKTYGHPPIHTKKLLKVPWLEINDGSRKKILAGKSNQENSHDENTVNQRLRDLGYMT